MNDKRRAKALKYRRKLFAFIIILDIILCPIISFLVNTFLRDRSIEVFKEKTTSLSEITTIYQIVLKDKEMLIFVGVLQIMVLAILLKQFWNIPINKRADRISNDLMPGLAGNGEFGEDRWMTHAEKDKEFTVWYYGKMIEKGGFVLGYEYIKSQNYFWKKVVLKFWIYKEDGHLLLIGTTRSGKSRKIYLPTIWLLAQAGESMIVTDPKGELYLTSKEYLEKMGYKVIVLDFRNPLKSNQWDMLHKAKKLYKTKSLADTESEIKKLAHLISVVNTSGREEPIWINGKQSTIEALMLTIITETDIESKQHMGSVYHLLAAYSRPLQDDGYKVPIIDYIDKLGDKHSAYKAMAAAMVAAYRTRSSFFTNVLTDLSMFSNYKIEDMTRCQDHNIENIGKEKTAVFIRRPDDDSTYNNLVKIYIEQCYEILSELADKNGGALDIRVNFLADEFGNLPKFKDFATRITVSAGKNMRWLLGIQDLGQIESLYKNDYETITGNCQVWLYLLSGSTKTCDIISKKLGKYTIETTSYNSNLRDKGDGSYGSGSNLTGKNLLSSTQVARFPNNETLIWSLRNNPARLPVFDLSELPAYKDFGFPSPVKIKKKDSKEIIEKKIDKNKENEKKVRLQRENQRNERKYKKIDYFEIDLHELYPPEEEDEEETSDKDKTGKEQINMKDESKRIDVARLDISKIIESNLKQKSDDRVATSDSIMNLI